MTSQVKLRVADIDKSFPGVHALDHVCFEVRRGSVHALCGENGAGKSTLMKIINGLYQPDSGTIEIDGKPVVIENPMRARALGIAMIAQELNFVPELSIEENLFLGRLPGHPGRVDWRDMRRRTAALFEREQLSFDPGQKMKTLSVSEIQQLEILKALSLDAQIIIMDEPTSSITESETAALFEKIRALKADGRSVIYISHKLDEIFAIADEVSILRDGQAVGTYPIETISREEIIHQMVGRTLDQVYPKTAVPIGDVLMKVDGLSQSGEFKDISFDVRAGEIVGFAGLVGSGRTEVMRAVFGLDLYESGTVTLNQQVLSGRTVRDRIRAGIGMVTEDRKRSGIVSVRSIRENAVLASLSAFFYGGRLHAKEEAETCLKYFKQMDVKAPDLETPIGSLSGGNQQKIILSKWMMREPQVLILDEPTRGIDVGNKHAIYELMIDIARQGKAIVMVSSELPELLGMCDRIYVMNQGRLTGEVKRADFDQARIMTYATM